LHGDGTNGAQNNTFLDSSTNAFTITRNGNTTQGSFSPYGSNWSNNFNGSTGYLAAPSSSAFNVSSNNVTAEAWIYLTAFTTGGSPFISTIWSLDSSGSQNTFAYVYSSGAIAVGINGVNEIASSTGVISLNTWYHTAVVRNGSTTTIYVNGVSVASNTTSVWANTGSRPFLVGSTSQSANYYFNGYISNVRFVNGTAVYTTAFTPPTTPLTAITNTSILTCQSNRFVDNSTNNFTITTTGSPSVQRFNPFGTATAYSTSVIGGSGYFDGSGDYLTIPSTSAFNFGSNNFTVEFWWNTTTSGQNIINPTGTGNGWAILISSGNLGWNDSYNVTALFTVNATSILDNAWHHVAFVRLSGTTYVYFDGVLKATNADPTVYSLGATDWYIGKGNVADFNGYMCDLRINNGTAVYTSAFTPPTAPLTAITNTQLLTNFTNGAIFDNAMINDLQTVGNAQISTSVKKYGTGSLAFDGTDDVLSFKNNPSFAFGTGSFTIEFWINGPLNNDKFILEGRNAIGTMHITTGGSASTAGVLRYVGSSTIVSSNVITDSTWHHCAIVRNGSSNITLYVDGVSVGTGTDTTNYTTTTGTFDGLGGRAGVGNYITAYIDDFRITKGYARYTANFTPPTAALSDTGPY